MLRLLCVLCSPLSLLMPRRGFPHWLRAFDSPPSFHTVTIGPLTGDAAGVGSPNGSTDGGSRGVLPVELLLGCGTEALLRL